MIARTTAVELIPAIGHDEAMQIATVEWGRLLSIVDDLQDEQWLVCTDRVPGLERQGNARPPPRHRSNSNRMARSVCGSSKIATAAVAAH